MGFSTTELETVTRQGTYTLLKVFVTNSLNEGGHVISGILDQEHVT
jgi:hypothetical protein